MDFIALDPQWLGSPLAYLEMSFVGRRLLGESVESL
jgi:hypothetical protein